MKKIIPILIAILICFGCRLYCFLFSVGAYSTGILHWTNLLLHHLIWLFPLLGALSICAWEFLSGWWHMWTIRSTNDYQIIRVPGSCLILHGAFFFFYLRSPLLGFANILVLDVLVVYYMIESYPVKKSSAYLFVPYLLWLILATYLNGYILMYN